MNRLSLMSATDVPNTVRRACTASSRWRIHALRASSMAMLAIACSSSQGYVSSRVVLSGVSVQLTDLTPNNGHTSELRFTSPGYPWWGTGALNQLNTPAGLSEDFAVNKDFGPISNSLSNAFAFSASEVVASGLLNPISFSARGAATGIGGRSIFSAYASMPLIPNATGSSGIDFSFTGPAILRIEATARYRLWASGGDGWEQASGSAKLCGSWIGVGAACSGPDLSIATPYDPTTGRYLPAELIGSRQIVIQIEHYGGDFNFRQMGMYSAANGVSYASQVPEATTVAMMSLGVLTVFGASGVARGRGAGQRGHNARIGAST